MDDKIKTVGKEYQVLARKYRPTTFSDLVGQDIMVKILTNSFSSLRIAHSFMLTGVRGVGKTTTARIIAKGLNCVGSDGKGKITISPCNSCKSCESISQGRNVDVLELDAASRTGVADIREIIDSVYYRAASERYKIYIIDEVHMLSTSAFNALLKTLEEPPPHVKFIFATTEIQKIPATILSRCQRFDLRRIETEDMVAFLDSLSKKEKRSIGTDCLGQIAKISEGSMRDSLSLLEKVFTDIEGEVTLSRVREILGLVDRISLFDIFESILEGDILSTLQKFNDVYRDGIEPVVLIRELAEIIHWVTLLKISPKVADEPAVSAEEKDLGLKFAKLVSMRILTKLWQLFLKIQEEIKLSHDSKMAVEMGLIRVVYASSLPTPDEIIKSVSKSSGETKIPKSEKAIDSTEGKTNNAGGFDSLPNSMFIPKEEESSQYFPQNETPKMLQFEDVVELMRSCREIELLIQVEEHVKVVHYQHGKIEFEPTKNAPHDLAYRLNSFLNSSTSERWVVSVIDSGGAETIKEQKIAHKTELQEKTMKNPLVLAVLERFPGAIVKNISEKIHKTLTSESNVNPVLNDNLIINQKE